MSDRPSLLRRFGRGLDGLRRFAVNTLFLGLLVGLVIAAVKGRPKVPDGVALVLKPEGAIVEQIAGGDPLQKLLAESTGAGSATKETLLKDLLDAVRAAKDDKRIKALFLDTGDMTSAGMTKLRDLRAALLDFKKSGKRVVAYADSYQQTQYYLAAQADEVNLHPQGMALLEGFGRWRNYYKDGLDRFGVEMHVFRVGEYKSAVEPFLRNDMSKEAKEMALEFYGDLWRDYLDDVAVARKLEPKDITAVIESFPERLRAVGGDMAKLALESKMVDRLAARDEVRKSMIALVGEDKETKSFRQIGVTAYLAALGGDRTGAGKGDAVAVVVAKGDILNGTQPPGRIGGDSTARIIRKAREDASVKALVLRVDSGGGSAFASEIIRRECELTQGAGKPVVVSMGSVAASGGYWIATSSDEIWASPETITGSIGIFGLFPTVEKPLAKYLGIHADGVGTTRFADAVRPDRAMDPAVADIFQQSINHGYEEFLERVSKARKMTREQVDKIARGRVWSGEDAKGLGLVDHLGGLTQAIESAAARAKLAKVYRVFYVEKEKSFRERVTDLLATGAAAWVRAAGGMRGETSRGAEGQVEGQDNGASSSSTPASPFSVPGRLRALEGELRAFAAWNDPRGIYAHCLCGDE